MTYTHGHHESVLRSHRWRTVENSAAYLVPHLVAGAHVLDVGCGPGNITADLASRVAPGEVIGVDQSGDVIEQATRDFGDVATFTTGDVYALDFDDDSFDIVHAHQVLQHLPDPVSALREMRRVCKPDGVVAARDVDYESATWYPADPALDAWLQLYRDIHRANGSEPDAARHLLAWANAAEFSTVTTSASVWCFAVPAEREWWGSLWADRTTKSAIAEQALRDGFASQSELEAIAAAWRRWVAHPDAWFAVIHGEVLATP